MGSGWGLPRHPLGPEQPRLRRSLTGTGIARSSSFAVVLQEALFDILGWIVDRD